MNSTICLRYQRRIFHLWVSICLVCVGTVTTCFANPTLQEILQSYRKAIGDAGFLEKLDTWQVNAKYTNAGGTWVKPMRIMVDRSKIRTEMDVQPGLQSVSGYDGTHAWSINPWSGSLDAQPMNTSGTISMILQSELLKNDLVYTYPNTRLELGDNEEIEGSDCFKIIAYKSGGIVKEYFIDKDAYLVIKIITKTLVDGEESETAVFFSNYQTVRGVLLPYAIESSWGGGTFIESVNFQPSLNNSLFSIPVKVAPSTPTEKGL